LRNIYIDKGLVFLIIISFILRIVFVPFTSGSDIPQFAGFADTFLRHGFCFYKYADGSKYVSENWAYSWPYIYGPVLIFILSFLRILAPEEIIHYWKNNNYYVFVPIQWIVAVKSIFVLFDLLVIYVLYIILDTYGLTRRKRLLLTSLYALNPMTIYISSIYGMFDQIALFFFLLTIHFYRGIISGSKSNYALPGAFLALSILTKQTMIFPLIFILLDILYRSVRYTKKFLIILTSFVVISILLMLPFEITCPGSMFSLWNAVSRTSSPGYTLPVVYSFNGLSSLASYINMCCGKDTLYLIIYWWVPTIVFLTLLFITYLETRDPFTISLLSYIVFQTTYWRINHQYLVPGVAFLILLFQLMKKCMRCRILGIIIIILIGFWPIMFPTSWWAHVHIREPNYFMWKLMDFFSLMIFDDLIYVLYALLLTITQYLFMVDSIIYLLREELSIIKEIAKDVTRSISLSFHR